MHCTEKHAARYVGRSDETLRKWRHEGLPHTVQQIGGKLERLYNTDDLDEFRDLMAERYRHGCGRPKVAS